MGEEHSTVSAPAHNLPPAYDWQDARPLTSSSTSPAPWAFGHGQDADGGSTLRPPAGSPDENIGRHLYGSTRDNQRSSDRSEDARGLPPLGCHSARGRPSLPLESVGFSSATEAVAVYRSTASHEAPRTRSDLLHQQGRSRQLGRRSVATNQGDCSSLRSSGTCS